MTMQVLSVVNIAEINDIVVKMGEKKQLEVRSHWGSSHFIDLKFEDKTITVGIKDLNTAIQNVTRS